MVIFLGFNLAETTLAQPRSQAQQKPNLGKALMVEDECEENPVQWEWQEPKHAGNQDSKNKFGRKLTWVSLRFQETCWTIKSSPLWQKGHMANKILISSQSLISYFLKSPVNRQVAVSAIKGLWRGYSPLCPKGSTILCTLVALPKWVGVLLSLILFMPRIRPMKTVSTDQVFSRFSGRLWKGFLNTFSLLFFSSHPLAPLSIYATDYKVLGRSSSFHFWKLCLKPFI